MTDDDAGHSDVDPERLAEIRLELERSADEINRLTRQLTEQTAVVERLETLISRVFSLLPGTAVVVDANGHIAAVSEGPAHPTISQAAVGREATAVLPRRLGDGIIALARAHEAERRNGGSPEQVGTSSPDGDRWVAIDDAQVLALPEGWALALLGS